MKELPPNEDCAYSETSCTVCDINCEEVSGRIHICGDNVLDEPEEECDNGNNNSDTEAGACRLDCTSSTCGDNVVDTNEVCDEGLTPDQDCEYAETSCAVCDTNCEEVAGIIHFCGDEVKDTGEEACDDGTSPSQDCTYGEASCYVCNTTCQKVSGNIHVCGDGEVDEEEGCDEGANNNSSTAVNACRTGCFYDLNISLGISHTCSTYGGKLFCWGYNNYGGIGDRTSTDRKNPKRIGGKSDWTHISSGASYTCGFRNNKNLYCWGRNRYGKLGDGTTLDKISPTPNRSILKI